MNNKSCTGVIFKGRTSQFFDKKKMSFQYRESFTLLKRRSCKCWECEDLIKILECDAGNLLMDCTFWSRVFNHGEIQNDSEYRMIIEDWDCDDGFCIPEHIRMELIK